MFILVYCGTDPAIKLLEQIKLFTLHLYGLSTFSLLPLTLTRNTHYNTKHTPVLVPKGCHGIAIAPHQLQISSNVLAIEPLLCHKI